MKKPRVAGFPLRLLVALAGGLAGCQDDGNITEPPPPPPPPAAAEISIVSFVDPESGDEFPEGEDGIEVGGRIGVVIEFDTGGAEAQTLDLILEAARGGSVVVPCDDFQGQGAVGLRADAETVMCGIDTGQGDGTCQGQALLARFENDRYTASAALTLADGRTIRDESVTALIFDNGNEMGSWLLDIGPRVVSLGPSFPDFGVQDGTPFWGGPRDLTWTACPIVFDEALADICRIEISGGTLSGSGDLDFGNGPGQRVSSEEPFMYTAAYRSSTGAPVNEDAVEDDPAGGGSVIGDGPTGFRVFLCDGTNVTSSFVMESDVRHLDLTAPLCGLGSGCDPQIDAMDVPFAGSDANPIYSGGVTSLESLTDIGVGGTYGVDVTMGVFDCKDSTGAPPCDPTDTDNQTLIRDTVLVVTELLEDDSCPDNTTTTASTTAGAPPPHCQGAAPDAGGIDSYYMNPTVVADALGNELGDGTGDNTIPGEFDSSGAFGTDYGAPSTLNAAGATTFQPDDAVDPFTWLTSADSVTYETFMFSAVDPVLASMDAGSQVNNDGCAAACGDGSLLTLDLDVFVDPAGAPVAFPLTCVETDGAGVLAAGSGMFECDVSGLTDGAYGWTTQIADRAEKIPNVTVVTQNIIVDTSDPVFGALNPPPVGSPGTDASSIVMIIGGTVNDVSVLSPATVTVSSVAGPNGACAGSTVLVVPADIDRNAVSIAGTPPTNAIAFNETFTVNEPAGSGTITYCFDVLATDAARSKTGAGTGNTATLTTQVDVTWNP